MDLKASIIVDAKGLACPMPIVKTKKAMDQLDPGNVIEVQATDRGSEADIQAWAESSGNQYLGMLKEGKVLRHFLRKSLDEERFERQHPHVIHHKDLEQRIQANPDLIILDVREVAEYAFRHIPNAISIPLGELDERMDELNQHQEIVVVCNTGQRSDLAAQKLAKNGFPNVINLVPGMRQWKGKTTGMNL